MVQLAPIVRFQISQRPVSWNSTPVPPQGQRFKCRLKLLPLLSFQYIGMQKRHHHSSKGSVASSVANGSAKRETAPANNVIAIISKTMSTIYEIDTHRPMAEVQSEVLKH